MNNFLDSIYGCRAITQLVIGDAAAYRQTLQRGPWMLVPLSGAGLVKTDRLGEVHRVTGGSALIGTGPMEITLHAEEIGQPWELYLVEIAEVSLSGEMEEPVRETPLRWSANGDQATPLVDAVLTERADELLTLAQRLHYASYMLDDRRQRSLNAHLLVQQMMLWWHGSRPPLVGSRRTTEQAVREVREALELRFDEGMTRESLAAQAEIAPAYFSVLFKRLTGLQPSVYLDRLRVHRAVELLLQARESKGDLEEIARRVGYRDAWYLSKRFRLLMGSSPATFRKGFVPQRAASLQYPYTHHLLALGITPVAAHFDGEANPIAPELAQETTELPELLAAEEQRQLLQASRPDVIITYDTQELQAKWRGIAPVVHVPWLGMSWRDHLRLLGRLFGREDRATGIIASIDRKAEEARRQVRKALGTPGVSIFKLGNNRCYLYGVRDVGCIFYELLGLEPPERIRNLLVKEPQLHSIEIDWHQMSDCASALNVVLLVPGNEQQRQEVDKNEDWNAFRNSTEHRFLYLDYKEWLHYDPVHIEKQLNQVIDLILNTSNEI